MNYTKHSRIAEDIMRNRLNSSQAKTSSIIAAVAAVAVTVAVPAV